MLCDRSDNWCWFLQSQSPKHHRHVPRVGLHLSPARCGVPLDHTVHERSLHCTVAIWMELSLALSTVLCSRQHCASRDHILRCSGCPHPPLDVRCERGIHDGPRRKSWALNVHTFERSRAPHLSSMYQNFVFSTVLQFYHSKDLRSCSKPPRLQQYVQVTW